LNLLCPNPIALIYYFVILALFAVKNLFSPVLVLDKRRSARRDQDFFAREVVHDLGAAEITLATRQPI